MARSSETPEKLVINGIEIELFRRGFGPPLLYLHGIDGPNHHARFLHQLSQRFDVIAPTHSGFGNSVRPAHLRRIDDLAFLYLDLIDQLSLDQLVLIGSSLGGWIAAELAGWCSHSLSKLILVAPLGLKATGGTELADIFIRDSQSMAGLLYDDPAKHALESSPLSEERLALTVRNRAGLAHYAWDPYMHNPQLAYRLHRIHTPTLIIRGASDGFVSQQYVENYSRMILGSQIELIPAAGHEPQFEQPERFITCIETFLAA